MGLPLPSILMSMSNSANAKALIRQYNAGTRDVRLQDSNILKSLSSSFVRLKHRLQPIINAEINNPMDTTVLPD